MRGAGRSAARQAGTPLIRLGSQHGMKKTKFLYPPPFRLSHNPGIALTGTWCAPGIREGGGAGPVAWRKRGWKFSSEARARFAAPPHRQRPPRGPRRSGKTTGGALGRRHTFTLRGTDPAPRFPTAPDRESSLTMARRESGRGNGEECAQCSPHGLAQPAVRGVRSGRRRRRKANDLAFRTTNARSHSEGPGPAGQEWSPKGDEKPTIWLFERRTPGAIAKGRVRQDRSGRRRATRSQRFGFSNDERPEP